MTDTQATPEQTREAAIREHFPMPADIRKHASAANHDLNFGPYSPDFWQEEENDPKQPLYDFGHSLSIFAEWVRELDTVWYESDSGMVCTSEPTGEFWRDDPETDEREYTFDPFDPSPNSPHLDEQGVEWNHSEPEPYWEIDCEAVADAYGYATLLTYA